MGYRTTSAAGLTSSRGFPWVGKAAVALAMLVVTSALAAWVVDFDIVAWLRNPQSTRSAGAFSFDDRFGSGSARNAPSIRYPSRPVTRSARMDFDAEFGLIESRLAELAPDAPDDRPQSASQSTIPLPRSRPAEASLALRVDPPPPAQARSDDRTMFQKLSDRVPMRFTLASLTP
ncbi:MAG: hypothetical protein ACRED3_21515, partial [Bradyrhizobium sp.]